MARMTFKEWRFECSECGKTVKKMQWNYQDPPEHCGKPTHLEHSHRGNAPTVIGDEIDVLVEHGPCNEDGTPRRYRSRSELNREATRMGWTRDGETPHPERIDWTRR